MTAETLKENTTDVKCIWDARATLGEGPVWLAEEQALYWVDILQSRLHRYALDDCAKRSWDFPGNISSIAPHRDGGFIATFSEGVFHLDLETEGLNKICDPEAHLAANRMNDGCCDTGGNYWFGSMDAACEKPTGAFYRLDREGTCTLIRNNIVVTNGPAFSGDGRYAYFTDTSAGEIYRTRLDAQGGLRDWGLFYRFSEGEGKPDGMCVDVEGYVWVAHWGGGCVSRHSPKGEMIAVVPVPAPNVTKCVFGGGDMKTLFITTARIDVADHLLDAYPLAGGLFSLRTDVAGFSYPPYGGSSA